MATSPIQIDPQTGERISAAKSAAIAPSVPGGAVQIDPTTGERIPPPPPPPPSMLQQAGGAVKNFGTGILKGAGSTANNIGSLVYPHWLQQKLTGQDSSASEQKLFQPQGTAQALGKGAEQVGEFMIPGAAEEEGAAKLTSLIPQAGKAIPKLLTSAAGAGLVNKAQGGSFSGGAAAGAAGAGIGQGLKAAAPLVAELALGIPKAARAFGKTPGEAIINETKGIRPDTIADSAQSRLGQLTPQLESAAAASPAKASLLPARHIVMNAGNKAASQNASGLFDQLGKQGDFLNYGGPSGEVTPSKLLDLKRGFNEEHLRWNPEMHDRALSTGRQAYGAMDKELDRTVPEAAGLNQRISSLIPVAQRAESVSREPGAVPKTLMRFGKHTGALAAPIGLGGAGATVGYHEGGLPGAVAGGLTGVLAPELIASPEGQMAAARLLGKAKALRGATGLVMQGTRGNQ
jgi:hypothetical protein